MKIITLSKLTKKLKPFTATLVGDVFDLFNIGHVRFLRACSKIGRPLVVIVQADKAAKIRSGFGRPIMNEKQRSEMVAALEFVNFVLIVEKPSDYPKYLEKIKPLNYVYPRGIMKHRRYGAYLIKKKFPQTKVVFVSNKASSYGLNYIFKKISSKRDHSKIKDPIVCKLYSVADNSKATVGKISALITVDDRIIVEADNVESKNMHAECIAMKKAISQGVDFKKAKLYILIPPCILCSQEILKNKISKVYYLHNYGNDDGLKLLRENGIQVKKYQKK